MNPSPKRGYFAEVAVPLADAKKVFQTRDADPKMVISSWRPFEPTPKKKHVYKYCMECSMVFKQIGVEIMAILRPAKEKEEEMERKML